MRLRRTIGVVLAVSVHGIANAAVAGETAYNWTGFYVGATAGGAWSKDKVDLDAAGSYLGPDASTFGALGSTSFKDASGIFGAKAGLNGQFENWVLGLEGDWSSLRFRQSASIFGHPYSDPSPSYFSQFDESVSSDWLATVRGRAGYAYGRALFYGTAGLAFGNQRFSGNVLDHAPFGTGNGSAPPSASGVKTGWAAGGGLDYALSGNWIVSAEYLHVDLGKLDAKATIDTGITSADLNFSSRLDNDIVRAGIAYKFSND
jgi:outer membrane immunogenic protein